MTVTYSWVIYALGSVAFFVAVWTLVLWITSRASGWRRLAERYGETALFAGEVVRFGSARIGWANYNGSLNVGANDMGVYLAPMTIFRAFHPPLFIPWSQIQAEPFRGFPGGITLTFPVVTHTRIQFFGRAVAVISPHLER